MKVDDAASEVSSVSGDVAMEVEALPAVDVNTKGSRYLGFRSVLSGLFRRLRKQALTLSAILEAVSERRGAFAVARMSLTCLLLVTIRSTSLTSLSTRSSHARRHTPCSRRWRAITASCTATASRTRSSWLRWKCPN